MLEIIVRSYSSLLSESTFVLMPVIAMDYLFALLPPATFRLDYTLNVRIGEVAYSHGDPLVTVRMVRTKCCRPLLLTVH